MRSNKGQRSTIWHSSDPMTPLHSRLKNLLKKSCETRPSSLPALGDGISRLESTLQTLWNELADLNIFPHHYAQSHRITLVRVCILIENLRNVPWAQLTQYREINCEWESIVDRPFVQERLVSYGNSPTCLRCLGFAQFPRNGCPNCTSLLPRSLPPIYYTVP